MTTYDINLNQGDTNDIAVILKAQDVGANLADADITFVMNNSAGVLYSIPCTKDATTPDGNDVKAKDGGITIPFDPTHTSVPGQFSGQFLVMQDSAQTTFPSDGGYLKVMVWESLS